MTQMKEMQKKRTGEHGNVLFLILIAVALFAALSYAVTQSSRSGAGDAAGETNLINSSTLTQYPAGIRTALVRMIVSNGATADVLAFNTPSDFPLTDNTLSVFHPAGGGATYALAPSDVMAGGGAGTWHFNGNFEIPQLGTAGADGNEVIAFLPNISRAVCLRLNTEYGITAGTAAASPNSGVPLVALTDANVIDDQLEGDALPTTDQEDIDNATNDLRGQPFGCFYEASMAQYVYYHVLLER